ncbi:MAG: AAA family ATPase [Fimbriiglobus sp.]
MKTWDDFVEANLTQVVEWAEREPWVPPMRACIQDEIWHAEGDVWTHTKLVLHELTRLDLWATATPELRAKLLCVGLFHDAGKPATTLRDPDTGRVHAPKHSIVGMQMARAVLWELGCPLMVREEICQLIRYHGRPVFLLKHADPVREAIRLSWVLNPEHLLAFALADLRGRDHDDDGTHSEEDLQLAELHFSELGCLRSPYAFANDEARFRYFRDELSSLHYTPREDHGSTVTMLAGLPGAGKDTWLKTQTPDLPVVSLDELRTELDIDATDEQGQVIQTARERCREYLRAKQDVAFNATNVMEQLRARWINLFADYGARIEIVYIEPSSDTLYRQNASRQARVPRQVIEKLISKREPPTLTEAHRVRSILSS